MTAGTPSEEERRREPGRPSPRFGVALAFLAAGLAAYGASLLLADSPGLVEAVYVPWITGRLVSGLSRAAGVVPLAVGELLVAAYLVWRGWTAVRGLRSLFRAGEDRRSVLARGAAVVVRDAGVIVLLFYLLWGFNYARAPVAERIGLPAVDAAGSDSLVADLAEESVREANRAYRALHGSDDAGSPTGMPATLDALTPALARGWERAARDLRLDPVTLRPFGAPKPGLTSPLLARLGLVGFYFPFTGEPVLNVRAPAVTLAATVAHEQAHQRGVTHEGDATFLGHMVASRSGDPLLRYSAAVRTQRRLLAALARWDEERATELRERRLPGVRRDLRDLAAYVRRHEGPAREVARSVNDSYLRANRVPGGVESYAHVTDLLLRYGQLHGRLFEDGHASPDRN